MMKTRIVHPDETEFDELVQRERLVLVDFWAEWCMPCKMLAPVIEQLADRYAGEVTVAKVDIDEHEELAARFEIQSIPTILLFEDGQLVEREVGVQPLEAFTALVDARIASARSH